jgi:hypothetical protein
MNFNYEQVMDMGFPTSIEVGRMTVCRHGFYEPVHDWDNWPLSSDLGYVPVPTVEEVYATLRSGLFLKHVHSAKDGLVFQFWLEDVPELGKEVFYASGRDLCEVVCNAYLRSKMKPNNPQTR